jgi:hypothetical protein
VIGSISRLRSRKKGQFTLPNEFFGCVHTSKEPFLMIVHVLLLPVKTIDCVFESPVPLGSTSLVFADEALFEPVEDNNVAFLFAKFPGFVN